MLIFEEKGNRSSRRKPLGAEIIILNKTEKQNTDLVFS